MDFEDFIKTVFLIGKTQVDAAVELSKLSEDDEGDVPEGGKSEVPPSDPQV